LLVRKVRVDPVTGSFTIFFSEGKRVPICPETDVKEKIRISRAVADDEKFFIYIRITY
jgi:hypothetical protein